MLLLRDSRNPQDEEEGSSPRPAPTQPLCWRGRSVIEGRGRRESAQPLFLSDALRSSCRRPEDDSGRPARRPRRFHRGSRPAHGGLPSRRIIRTPDRCILALSMVCLTRSCIGLPIGRIPPRSSICRPTILNSLVWTRTSARRPGSRR